MEIEAGRRCMLSIEAQPDDFSLWHVSQEIMCRAGCIINYWVIPRLAAGYPSNLISLCVLRARTSLSDLLLIAPSLS